MATKQEIANNIASFIRRNSMEPSVIDDICKKIDSLTYESSGNSLSVNDKKELIKLIEESLSNKRKDGYRYITEAEDSTSFIALMKAVMARYQK